MNTREKTIQSQVLRAASMAKPYLLEETIIYTNVNFSVRPKATLAEFDAVCARMEERALIKRVRTDDGGLKIKLTDEGEAELQS